MAPAVEHTAIPAAEPTPTPAGAAPRPSRAPRVRHTHVGDDARTRPTSRFRAIVDLSPVPTIVADAGGCISFVNRQAIALFGYTRKALIGRPIEMLVPERFRALHRQQRSAFLAAPRARQMAATVQLYVRGRNGHEFPVEISLSPLGAAGAGQVIVSFRAISAISAHHLLEAAQATQASQASVEAMRDELLQLRAAEQAVRTEARAATEELWRLQSLTDTALSHLALDNLLDRLLDRIQAVMDVDDVGILLLEADGQRLKLQAARGMEDAVAAKAPIPVGQGISGRVAATRLPLVVDDLSKFDGHHPELRATEHSAACVPLQVENRLLGVIYVATASARCFSMRDVQLLQRAADRIALSIDRARLFEDERRARREAEAAHANAARQAEELDRVFEAMADAIVIHDEQGQIVRTNASARRLLGLHTAPPDFYTLPSRERIALFDLRDQQGHPIVPQEASSARALHGEVVTGTAAIDFRMRSLDGRDVDVNLSMAPLRDGDGRIIGSVNILRDQTERIRLAREREEAYGRELALRETNERLETYVAMAAHDLRSPLAISRMQIDAARHLLLKKAEQTRRSSSTQFEMFAQVATTVESVQQNVDRLWRLVQQLMDAARARAGILALELRPVHLDALVRDCIEDLRLLTPSRPLILDLPPAGSVAVDADPDRLNQVVSNLLSNAARYSDEDRPIRVALRVVGAKHKVVRVQVRDHGIGIPSEEQATIWERYQRARTQQEATGLGLGLYIVRTIVELHGGRVGLKSTPGKGSTFWFTLPLESTAS